MTNLVPRTLLMVPWFGGPLPPWMPHFIQSCRRLHAFGFEFHIFTDDPNLKNYKFKNASDHFVIQGMPQGAMRQLVREHLGIDFPTIYKDKRKWGDIRPGLGELANGMGLLQGFDYWGYFDLDVIFGRLERFFPPRVMQAYDVLTVDQWRLTGPLSIFRNSVEVNSLWSKEEGIRDKLGQEHYAVHDELGISQIVWREYLTERNITAFFSYLHAHDRQRGNPARIRYNPKTGVLRDQSKPDGGKEVALFHFPGMKKWPL